jgi:trehalose-phosphatase
MTQLLLAADFDGTIAAIADDPGKVAIEPQFAAFLRRAAERGDVEVAIVSGRDVDDLATRIGGVPAYLAGSHGLEITSPAGAPLRSLAPTGLELDPDLERDAASLGLRIERKKHAIALHWREAPEVDESHPVVQRFSHWAREHRLDVIRGRRVLEARSKGGGKEEALRYLAACTGADRVVYAGDDFTDFAAIRFAAARGRGFFVASDERDAPSVAITVQSRDELLRQLLAEVNGLGVAE